MEIVDIRVSRFRIKKQFDGEIEVEVRRRGKEVLLKMQRLPGQRRAMDSIGVGTDRKTSSV